MPDRTDSRRFTARAAPARPSAGASRWLGLGDASRLLGVSPATLRRWADAGRVKAFTTPGGHRRFDRHALQRLLPSSRERRPAVVALGFTTDRLSRHYRRSASLRREPPPWTLQLDDADRDRFRAIGRQVVGHLLLSLDAADPGSAAHHLREGQVATAAYGRLAARLGLSLSETVEGFLRFRRPFMSELLLTARRRGLDTEEATSLLQDAESATDRLLLATMTGHSVGSVGAPRATPHLAEPERPA